MRPPFDGLIPSAGASATVERAQLRATVVGFLLAAAVFAVMFYLLDARAVVAAARRADLTLLAGVAALMLLWNVAWGVVLWNVLQSLDVAASIGEAVLINAAASFANHVTPFGQAGGEPVTAWLVTRSTGTDYEVSLAGVASLDAINMVPSLTLAVVGVSYYLATASPPFELGRAPAVAAVALLTLVAVALVLWRTGWRPDLGIGGRLVGAVRRVAVAVPYVHAPDREAIADRVRTFVDSVKRVAGSHHRLAAALGFSALGWVLQGLALWLTFVALGSPVPVLAPLFVVPLGTIGSALPTPGGLGGTEAINVTAITLVTGVAPATAAAAVTIHSVGGYLLTTSVGAAATGVIGVRE
jgi:uncharacterized protein (TIRG00374 family)